MTVTSDIPTTLEPTIPVSKFLIQHHNCASFAARLRWRSSTHRKALLHGELWQSTSAFGSLFDLSTKCEWHHERWVRCTKHIWLGCPPRYSVRFRGLSSRIDLLKLQTACIIVCLLFLCLQNAAAMKFIPKGEPLPAESRPVSKDTWCKQFLFIVVGYVFLSSRTTLNKEGCCASRKLVQRDPCICCYVSSAICTIVCMPRKRVLHASCCCYVLSAICTIVRIIVRECLHASCCKLFNRTSGASMRGHGIFPKLSCSSSICPSNTISNRRHPC